MDNNVAKAFASAWISAWNSHDIDEIMTHYADDFEMTSPFIAEKTGGKTSTLYGKKAVGEYWVAALQRFPELKFELLDVLISGHSLVIYYKSVMDKMAAELFVFDESGKVVKAIAHYREASACLTS
jgi:ketosteroid isomerase-like protein